MMALIKFLASNHITVYHVKLLFRLFQAEEGKFKVFALCHILIFRTTIGLAPLKQCLLCGRTSLARHRILS